MPETETVETAAHRPEPWFWEAGSDKCPHGAEPDRDGPEWDTWAERHHGSQQDVFICLDAPAGDVCEECSSNHGEAVPWAFCDARPRARVVAGAEEPTNNPHRPVTVWVGTTECLERECEEYFTEAGDEIASKDRCSHIRAEDVCGGCWVVDANGFYDPAASWPAHVDAEDATP